MSNSQAHIKSATEFAQVRWIEISNASTSAASVHIYGDIGAGGVTSGAFAAALKDMRASTINVHLNSPGGSVFEGLAVYNALNTHPAKIVVHIDGIAASIASIIAMAGDEIVMAESAMMMIHRPSAGTGGSAEEMRATADVVDKIEKSLVGIYAARSGMSESRVAALMSSETWFTAAECLANGFATRITKPKGITASFDVSTFRNAASAMARRASPADAVAVANLLRNEFSARLAAKDEQISTLTAKLGEAEMLSAARLGVPPVLNISSKNDGVGSLGVLAHYRSLKGDQRTAFHEANADSIWRAFEQENEGG